MSKALEVGLGLELSVSRRNFVKTWEEGEDGVELPIAMLSNISEGILVSTFPFYEKQLL